jgi:hypothetical protein
MASGREGCKKDKPMTKSKKEAPLAAVAFSRAGGASARR